MAKVKDKKLSDEQKRQRERERKRKYRQQIKLDNVKFEEAKRKDRERKKRDKEEGKIKFIKDLTDREKRQKRKKWRIATSKYRNKLLEEENVQRYLETNTPPGSPSGFDLNVRLEESERKKQGKRRTRQRREKDSRKIKKLENSLEKSKKEARKWKKRFQRLKETEQSQSSSKSPGKVVKAIMRSGAKEVRKNLMLGVGLSMQIKENAKLCKSQEDKKKLAEHVSGDIIRKKKLKKVLENEKIISVYYQTSKDRKKERKKRKTNVTLVKGRILEFFEDAENTCLAPGKRDYITRKKIQKQKRYLLYSLKDLHKKFVEQTKHNISYQSFVKLKPFWVVNKKVDNRDTCVCIHHANFKFKLAKLKLLRLIKTTSSLEILKETVCSLQNKSCMYGTCKNCSLEIHDKFLNLNSFEDFNTFYYKWTSKVVEKPSKKSEEIIKVKRTIKEKIVCKASDLLKVTKSDLKHIAVHTFNMHNQHKQFKQMKEDMSSEEGIIICDWSENYSCKYAEEVQAIHFGASRNQISLHTGVVYLANDQKLMFCTASNSTSHGAVSIWTHLDPILKLIKNTYPSVKFLHFFTDGPTSQYRNKGNFYLMCQQTTSYGFKACSWNFWEAGHGKGPADGIGGLVKRTCDRAVALGKDVTNAEGFLETVKDLKMITILIKEEHFDKIASELKAVENKLRPVPGTLKLKSVSCIDKRERFTLILREQSCSTCRLKINCPHFPGSKLKLSWNLISTESYLESENNDMEADLSDSGPDNGVSCDPTAKSMKTGPLKRPIKYSDIYTSDSDSDDAEETKLKFKTNDFVVVKVFSKKQNYKLYIAQVSKCLDLGYQVRFMKRCPDTKNKFVFSTEPEACVADDEVVALLKDPSLVNARGLYVFDLPEQFKLLN